MIKSSCIETGEIEKKSFQRRQISSVERTLEMLRRAAITNNSSMWMAAEERFMNLLYKTEYGGLSTQTRNKYLHAYNNIIPEDELLLG